MPIEYIPHPIKAELTMPVRSYGVIYQNTRLRPILCLITILSRTLLTAADSAAYAQGQLAATSPPLNVTACGLPTFTRDHSEYDFGMLVLMVPAGYYYRVNPYLLGAGSTISATYWMEVEL